MKNLLLNQCRWLILPLLLISLNVGNAYGDSWTWTPSSTSSISGTSSSVTLNSKAWTVTRSANNYIGWNADYGIQFGSKKAGAETVTFTSSAFTGTISSIDVNCGSYNRSHTLSVKVNNTAYSLSGTIGNGSTTATVTATGSSSGTIEIKLTAGSRACYIKSISITYSAGASKTLLFCNTLKKRMTKLAKLAKLSNFLATRARLFDNLHLVLFLSKFKFFTMSKFTSILF